MVKIARPSSKSPLQEHMSLIQVQFKLIFRAQMLPFIARVGKIHKKYIDIEIHYTNTIFITMDKKDGKSKKCMCEVIERADYLWKGR